MLAIKNYRNKTILAAILAAFLLGCSSQIASNNSNNLASSAGEAKLNHAQLLSDLKVLSSDEFEGRKLGSAGNIKAQQYIIERLQSSNVAPFKQQYAHQFIKKQLFTSKQGYNVTAFVEGTEFSEKYIVFTAHYDHIGKKGYQIFNGADDNASGTAALLTFANKINKQPLKYSSIFLFTDGEEQNLSGAKAFIDDNQDIVSAISLNINMDMIAGDKSTKTLHYIDSHLDNLVSTELVTELINTEPFKRFSVKKGFTNIKGYSVVGRRTNWVQASDHGVFYQNNIPFIYFGVGEHKLYHSDKDNYENVNLAFFINASEYIYSYIRLIDRYLK
ncbi:M28 family peptidase [Thalassotalea sp. PLHSN55]|uniref:M28 family peptidase n=1 Tax=Thalassotalea sp. PLHSN55 TaxID=3435888 RepID=UPI003F86BD1F